MTDLASPAVMVSSRSAENRRDIGIKRRYAAERRFRAYGISAIAIGLFFLAVLLWSVVSKGYTAFQQTTITLPIEFSEKVIDPKNERATDPKRLQTVNYPVLVRDALVKQLGIDPKKRPLVKQASDMRQLGGETLFLSGTEMQLGRAEAIGDTAKVLSRYVDAIMSGVTIICRNNLSAFGGSRRLA